MRKVLLAIALSAVVMPAWAKKNDDPVLMTVNGKDIPVSEFLYLYGKNNGQSVAKMSVDEYLDLFVTYKLKVADAEACRLDTASSFKNEYNGYRLDLAKPYMIDRKMEDDMVAEAYEHKKREVDVSHIMVAKGQTPEDSSRQLALLDSIRTLIVGGADFSEVARKYSIDRAVVRNGGHMGWLMADRVPYSFEKAAYETPVGQISEPVETPFGYHIIRVEDERPASGEVLAQHILKLTQGHPSEEIAGIKESIDSIYSVLINSGKEVDFSEVARRESEDPGSASKGGMLPWFGRGRMVPEFENVAFELENGAISEPFQTSYGFHIIKRLDYRGIPSLDEVKPSILASMKKDGRVEALRLKKIERMKADYRVESAEQNLVKLNDYIQQHNGLDSLAIVNLIDSPVVLGSIDGQDFTTADIFLRGVEPVSGVPVASEYIADLIGAYINSRLENLELDSIERENPEFRHLLQEYHDGLLLFEISSIRVWNASTNDEDGLKNYFDNNRSKYDFEKPKYKGYVIYMASDSIYDDLNAYIHSSNPDVESLMVYMADKFGKDARLEKVIAAQGDNRFVDAGVFGGEAPDMKGRYSRFMLFGGSVIDHPQEMSDVRADVSADYQAELERRWIKDLKSKYPVKINKNQLKKLR